MRVTHPFHPLLDQELVLVDVRSARWGERVWYERSDGSVTSLPRAWTDLAPPDPFVTLAAGRCHFRPEDLLAVADLLDGLRTAGRPEEQGDGV